MTSKLTVRMGGAPADPTVDYTSVTPFFDAGSPSTYISGGNMWDNAGMSQGEATIVDDLGEIPRADDTRNLAAHNLVLWTENGGGSCDYWLSHGRQNTGEKIRGDHPWGNSQSIHFTWDDANWELRGLPIDPDTYPTGWSRPSETDVARASAVITTFCQRDPRYTTYISTDLIVNANTVTMPAKVYSPGTELGEILADCATAAGKGFGVVINHSGGEPTTSILLEEWTWDGGTATYTLHAINAIDGVDHLVHHDGPVTGDVPGTGAESTTYFDNATGGIAGTVGFKVTPGQTYRVTGWLHNYWTDGDGAQMVLRWQDSDFNEISHVLLGYIGNSADWQSFDGGSVIAPAGALQFQITCNTYADGSGPVRTGWRDQWRIYGSGSSTGCSHLSLLYTIPTDYTTFASTVKVSVDPADIDPTASPPVFAPIEDQGPISIGDGSDVPVSKVISSFANGTATGFVTADAGTAIVNSYDYYGVAVNDSLSVNATQAAARATAVLHSLSQTHVTGQVTVMVSADQVNLLSAGMPIQIKEYGGGQYLGTYGNRRIASLKWEPASPEAGGVLGKYYAHIQLDRAQRIVPGALPGSTGVSQGGAGSGSGAAVAAAVAATAGGTTYDPTPSSMPTSPTNVQSALDELQAEIDAAASLEVKEVDGTPDVTPVTQIIVPNGSLTDNGGGSVSLAFSAGPGSLGWINVVDYGATGDGTTDDTTSIQAAIADMTPGCTLYFPVPSVYYKITATLSITERGCVIRGDGSEYGTRVHMATSNTTAFSVIPTALDGTRNQTNLFRGLLITGPGSASSGRAVYASSDVHLENVGMAGFYEGLYWDNATFYSRAYGCFITNCVRGVVMNGTNNCTLDTCRITGDFGGGGLIGPVTDGVVMDTALYRGLTNRIINCSIEYFSGDGIAWNGGAGGEVIGNYFETQESTSTKAHLKLGNTNLVQALLISGNYFQGDGTSGFNAIAAGSTDSITLINNRFGVNSAIGIAASGAGNSNWLLMGNVNNPAGTFALPATSYTLDPANPPGKSRPTFAFFSGD